LEGSGLIETRDQISLIKGPFIDKRKHHHQAQGVTKTKERGNRTGGEREDIGPASLKERTLHTKWEGGQRHNVSKGVVEIL